MQISSGQTQEFFSVWTGSDSLREIAGSPAEHTDERKEDYNFKT